MKEMTFSELGSISTDYKIFGISLSFLLIIAGVVYCWRRSGSLHFFLDRLWFLIGGSKEFYDEKLNKDWKNVRDVELYRYRSGFSDVYSQKKIKEIAIWLSKNEIEFS